MLAAKSDIAGSLTYLDFVSLEISVYASYLQIVNKPLCSPALWHTMLYGISLHIRLVSATPFLFLSHFRQKK